MTAPDPLDDIEPNPHPKNDPSDDLVTILKEINHKIAGDSSDNASKEKIRLGELLEIMHAKGIILCVLVLAMPSFFPGLLPPFPSILAVPMILLGWQLVRNRNTIALPKFIARVPLGRKIMVKIITKFIYYLMKLPKLKNAEPFQLTDARETFVGFCVILFAVMMFIPFPFTNFLPSVGAAFLAIGVLKESWIYTVFGFVVGVIGVLVGLYTVIQVIDFAT